MCSLSPWLRHSASRRVEAEKTLFHLEYWNSNLSPLSLSLSRSSCLSLPPSLSPLLSLTNSSFLSLSLSPPLLSLSLLSDVHISSYLSHTHTHTHTPTQTHTHTHTTRVMDVVIKSLPFTVIHTHTHTHTHKIGSAAWQASVEISVRC